MELLRSMLVVTMVVTAKCQIAFPNIAATPDPNTCKASNGQPGTCYEFRSTNFKECSFFPSIDQSNPGVARHLKANLCRNTGSEVFFCCPSNLSPITEAPQQEDECGQSLMDNVVGGNRTRAGDWPWLAAIGGFVNGKFKPICGATLITKQHVISAAHCFLAPGAATTFKKIVRLGEYDVDVETRDDTALDFDIVDQRSGNYDHGSSENDIILLKLDRPLTRFTEIIRPACLPYHLRNHNFEGEDLIVVGWGIFDNNDRQTSNIPLVGSVPVVPIKECRASYSKINSGSVIDNRQLCAGTGGTDSCGGDSGGPLHFIDVNRGRFYLVGIVSFGPRNCGHNRLPGVYARVGHYLDWIDENLKELL